MSEKEHRKEKAPKDTTKERGGEKAAGEKEKGGKGAKAANQQAKAGVILAESSSQSVINANSEDFKILLFGDNHLGIQDDNPELREDSFDTMKEILNIGISNGVDFGIQSGNLMHDLHPSSAIMCQTLRLFEENVVGEKDSAGMTYHSIDGQGVRPNFVDKAKPIKLPILSIHGDRDFPLKKSGDSGREMLSITRYITAFGHIDNLEDPVLHPLVFSKKNIVVAVYGIGYIKETLCGQVFTKLKAVEIPAEIHQGRKVFKILVIHEKRKTKTGKVGLDVKTVPKGFDLIIWGNETESVPKVLNLGEKDSKGERIYFDRSRAVTIYQPGSSVIMQYTQSELAPKHIGLLTILGNPGQDVKPVRLDSLPLESVRILRLVSLEFTGEGEDNIKGKTPAEIEEVVKRELAVQLNSLEEDWKRAKDKGARSKKPLLRIMLEIYNNVEINLNNVEKVVPKWIGNRGEIFKLKRVSRGAAPGEAALGNPTEFITKLEKKKFYNTTSAPKTEEVKRFLSDGMRGSKHGGTSSGGAQITLDGTIAGEPRLLHRENFMRKIDQFSAVTSSKIFDNYVKDTLSSYSDLIAEKQGPQHIGYHVRRLKREMEFVEGEELDKLESILSGSLAGYADFARNSQKLIGGVISQIQSKVGEVEKNQQRPSPRESPPVEIKANYDEKALNDLDTLEAGLEGLALGGLHTPVMTGVTLPFVGSSTSHDLLQHNTRIVPEKTQFSSSFGAFNNIVAVDSEERAANDDALANVPNLAGTLGAFAA